jgi:hypothetical protein
MLSVRFSSMGLRLLARRRTAPEDASGLYDLIAEKVGSPISLVIPSSELHCHPEGSGGSEMSGGAEMGGGSAVATCEEWVIGIHGAGFRAQYSNSYLPQHRLTPFELTVRWEADAPSFACEADCMRHAAATAAAEAAEAEADAASGPISALEEDGRVAAAAAAAAAAEQVAAAAEAASSASTTYLARAARCTRCNSTSVNGWQAGHATQFLSDDTGHVVARLTNDTYQRGTLWLAQPQPYSRGFELNFSFRITEPSVCTGPYEVFGYNDTARLNPLSRVSAERPFLSMDELGANGDDLTHYLIDSCFRLILRRSCRKPTASAHPIQTAATASSSGCRSRT